MKLFPEWQVDITNNCDWPCVQKNVKLSCVDFESPEYVYPSVLNKTGDVCLVNSGLPLKSSVNFTFNYIPIANKPFNLYPISSQISC